MVAGILERGGARLVHNRAGANMAGGRRRRALLEGARRGDSGCSRSTSSGWTASPTQLRPRALLLANLFRDQLDRYGELETIADRWAGRRRDDAAAARWSSTPTTRSSPTSAATAPTSCTSASRTTRMAMAEMQHAADSKHCRRCGAPYVYDADLPRPPRPLPLPATAAARARSPRSPRDDVALRRHPRRGASRCARRPERARVALPLPGLYNVYNALGAAALATRSARRSTTSSPGCEAVAPAFGRAETVHARRPRRSSILLVKNPAGANEVLRTLVARARRARPARRAQRQASPTAATSRWVWDADFELLGRPRAPRDLRAAPAPRSWRVRMKYAGVAGRPHRRRARPRARRSTRAARRRRAAPLYALPTYTAMLALRDVLVEPRRGAGVVRG